MIRSCGSCGTAVRRGQAMWWGHLHAPRSIRRLCRDEWRWALQSRLDHFQGTRYNCANCTSSATKDHKKLLFILFYVNKCSCCCFWSIYSMKPEKSQFPTLLETNNRMASGGGGGGGEWGVKKSPRVSGDNPAEARYQRPRLVAHGIQFQLVLGSSATPSPCCCCFPLPSPDMTRQKTILIWFIHCCPVVCNN